MQDIKNI